MNANRRKNISKGAAERIRKAAEDIKRLGEGYSLIQLMTLTGLSGREFAEAQELAEQETKDPAPVTSLSIDALIPEKGDSIVEYMEGILRERLDPDIKYLERQLLSTGTAGIRVKNVRTKLEEKGIPQLCTLLNEAREYIKVKDLYTPETRDIYELQDRSGISFMRFGQIFRRVQDTVIRQERQKLQSMDPASMEYIALDHTIRYFDRAARPQTRNHFYLVLDRATQILENDPKDLIKKWKCKERYVKRWTLLLELGRYAKKY